jgi:hypothetical protein
VTDNPYTTQNLQASFPYQRAPPRIIPFPPRGPFAVRVEREQAAWLVVCRDHGWLHTSYRAAIAEAHAIARGFGVAVKVAP